MQNLNQLHTQLQDQLASELSLFGLNPFWSKLLVLAGMLTTIIIFSILCLFITRLIVNFIINRLHLPAHSKWIECAQDCHVFRRAAHLIPGFIIQSTAPLLVIPSLPFTKPFSQFLLTISAIYLLITGGLVISALLNTIDKRYRFFNIAKQRPIKSYVQVAKIILTLLTAICVGSVLLNRSPLYLLTGLGTMTAIIMLVFKDSLLGFVSSIQLAANDMVRIGDWIEMPSFGADGDVIDISLNTVKVQNFDKTIITIPSYALLTHGVKNWRGMNESGGRRIKRAIYVDINSIHFCDDKFVQRLYQLPFLKEPLERRLSEIMTMNQNLGLTETQLHRLTNLGAFRVYLETYLAQHPKIHHQLTFLIRQLQDSGSGIPIEIYIFTNDTNWVRYEAIQADIFEHIYAILPFFELRPFQVMSGSKLQVDIQQPATHHHAQPTRLREAYVEG